MPISKINSKALVDCSVAAVDIADNSITAAKLAGSIANAKLANSSVTINSTSISLGASANINALDWQSVIVADGSTNTTGVAGRGYFINTTSAAHTFTLPVSATRGDTIAIKDYAGTFATFNLTIARNGHKIQGVENNSLISTNRASVVLVYVDVTRGWEFVTESNVADLQGPLFISATGGTITTSGDFKIHTFTGDGCFVVATVGNPVGSDKVDYLVVAGGGGGAGRYATGGGGAGGFREGKSSPVPSYTASPLVAPAGLPVSATTYPITVGGGGAGGIPANPSPIALGQNGSPSVFSTITSAGGGGGGSRGDVPSAPSGLDGSPGGSGGGGAYSRAGGSGNTPPTNPSQGNNGGGGPSANYGSGGGGATAVGATSGPNPSPAGNGGAGATTSISGSPTAYAGGGGGGHDFPTAGGTGGSGGGGTGGAISSIGTNGSANTGGGGGGHGGSGGAPAQQGASGGSGIVIIRYKFQ